MSTEQPPNTLVQTPESKQQQVYTQLRASILCNDFPPGTVMVERKLCALYGVSRSPIRNALQQLTFEGLLTNQPGQGTVVPECSLEDILEIYDILEVLQLYAVRQCVAHLDAVATETLLRITKNMHDCLERGDLYGSSQWDRRFHDFIVIRASNQRLWSIFEQISNQQGRFLARTLDDKAYYERSYQEHMELYSAIVGKNITAAENTVRRHYATLRQYYINLLIGKDYHL